MSFVREFQRLLSDFAQELPEECEVPELDAEDKVNLYELSETLEEEKNDLNNK